MDPAIAMSAGAQVGYLSLALVALGVVIGLLLVAKVDAWGAIGGGPFAMEHDPDRRPTGAAAEARERTEREQELRQLLAAKAERQRRRGETPLDVEAELARLGAGASAPSWGPGQAGQAGDDLVGSGR